MEPPISRTSLINITIVIEASLLLVATIWCFQCNILLAGAMVPDKEAILYGAATGVAMSLVSMGIYWLGKWVSFLKQLREINHQVLLHLVSGLSWIDLVVLAAITGFCEEVFFRGVAQHQLDVWATSMIFGVFHDPTFKNVSYCVSAASAGLVLGFLYIWTGNLWAPIVAHTLHNLLWLLFLRYFVKLPPEVLDPPQSENV